MINEAANSNQFSRHKTKHFMFLSEMNRATTRPLGKKITHMIASRSKAGCNQGPIYSQ